MAFNIMGKKTPTVDAIVEDEKSLRLEEKRKRKGSTGTELLLTTNRRTASEQYAAAQRAENAYKAKKRSAGARQHRSDVATHVKASGHHMKEAIKSCWSMFASLPWVLRARKEDRQSKQEKKAMERDQEKKKKLEERLAKQEALDKETV